MRRLACVLAFALVGCGAAPLTPKQKGALVQRVRDLGTLAARAIQARDQARDDLAKGRGFAPVGPDRETIAFIDTETASLAKDVGDSLR